MRITTTTVYESRKGRAECTFQCRECLNKNRKRAFTYEYTVNPFNKNEDGSVKTSGQVWREAQNAAEKEKAEFMRYPMCRTCEDSLTPSSRQALREKRAGE
jgi:hypothetical protein